MKTTTTVIRTSDRATFRRCRRKWHLTSHLRQGLRPRVEPPYFWLGTGGHFALEDHHGYNYYESPVVAFNAYVEAQEKWASKNRAVELPEDYEEQADLGRGILENYLIWAKDRDTYETVWIDDEPQCEINLQLPLNDDVVYSATLDRLVRINGDLWIVDYKFNKQFDTAPLEWNGQMSAYIWAASAVYDEPIMGGILWQFRKAIPAAPKVLSNGTISTSKSQNTTRSKYKEALMLLYGDLERVPLANIECLNALTQKETPDYDKYIRREATFRTQMQQQSEGTKILMEIRDMKDPKLPLYPNPTKDCSWDCSVKDLCLMIDSDDDWESYIRQEFIHERRAPTEGRDDWRDYLPM